MTYSAQKIDLVAQWSAEPGAEARPVGVGTDLYCQPDQGERHFGVSGPQLLSEGIDFDTHLMPWSQDTQTYVARAQKLPVAGAMSRDYRAKPRSS